MAAAIVPSSQTPRIVRRYLFHVLLKDHTLPPLWRHSSPPFLALKLLFFTSLATFFALATLGAFTITESFLAGTIVLGCIPAIMRIYFAVPSFATTALGEGCFATTHLCWRSC